jgi:membrane associated rhomboid family serine protease
LVSSSSFIGETRKRKGEIIGIESKDGVKQMFQNISLSEGIRRFLKDKTVLNRLILFNLGIWFIINLIRVILFLFQTPSNPIEDNFLHFIENWLAVPAGLDQWISRPWTTFTYMFLHIDFWHLLINMLWLYWFGKIFLEFLNSPRLLGVYLLGGIAGALTFMAAFNFFPAFSQSLGAAVALGASASVLAVVVSTALLVPNYTIHLLFIGQVKIKFIAIFMIILDVFMLRSSNAGGHFAHIGGALAGLIYIFFMKQFRINGKQPGFFGFLKSLLRRKPRIKQVHRSGKPLSDEEYNAIKAQNQKRIDIILDKIAKSGYKSLTEAEKEFLFKFSNK